MVVFPIVYHAVKVFVDPLVYLCRKVSDYLTKPSTRVVRVGGGNIVMFLAVRGILVDVL